MFFGEESIVVERGEVGSKRRCRIGLVQAESSLAERVGWLDCSTLSFFELSAMTKPLEAAWTHSTTLEYSNGNLLNKRFSL